MQAMKLLRMLGPNNVIFTSHGRKRMMERKVDELDVVNVIKSTTAQISDGEWNDRVQAFGYALRTNKFTVVISFNDEGTKINLVTVTRKDR